MADNPPDTPGKLPVKRNNLKQLIPDFYQQHATLPTVAPEPVVHRFNYRERLASFVPPVPSPPPQPTRQMQLV